MARREKFDADIGGLRVYQMQCDSRSRPARDRTSQVILRRLRPVRQKEAGGWAQAWVACLAEAHEGLRMSVVPAPGLEPGCPGGREILSLLRLPISPSRRGRILLLMPAERRLGRHRARRAA